MKEEVYKKCMKCGALVKVIKDCECGGDCGIKCCGEKMVVVDADSVNAVIEND